MARALVDGENRTCTCRHLACELAGGLLGGWISVFWALLNRPTISASGLVGGTILSRVGLRGFDLCIQLIIQEVSCPHPFRSFIALLFVRLRNSLEPDYPGRASILTDLCCIGR
jgi:hypothetical protein